MEIDYKQKASYKEAQKRVKQIKGFYVHLLVYIFINIALFIVTTQHQGFINSLSHISNYSTIFFWGIGLLAHFVGVFGPNLFFGKDWEERKVKELMDKDKKQLWK